MSLHPRPAGRRPHGGDAGFTLVELVIAVMLVGVLTAAIAAAVGTSVFTSASTTQKVRESNDAQLLSAFLVRDAQAAGGTDPATAQADPTIGVSTTDPAGCAAPGTLVIRYSWNDRKTDFTKVAMVATYGFDATTHQLVRRACSGGTSQGDVVVGRQVASVVARCDGSTTCPNFPATTSLTVTETNSPANAPTAFNYTLSASLRSQAQTLPTLATATEAPLVALGSPSGTCPTLNFGGSAQVSVTGDVIVNGPGCSNPLNFQGNSADDYFATSTNVLSPAYNPPSLLDPFAGTPIPSGTCNPALTNPPISGGLLGPGTYHRSLTLPASAVVFGPGVYVFCNTVTVPSNAAVSGSGVLWYFKTGDLSLNGQATMALAAATSGTYANLLIWFDKANTNTSLAINGGNSVGSYNGILYAPNVDVTLNGGAGTSVGGIIAKSVSFTGSVCAHFGSTTSITITGTLPNGTVGQAYSAALGGSGGTAPYEFSAIGLPAGLAMSSAGVVTGTPTTPGPATATITAVDDRCNAAVVTRTLTIAAAPVTVTVASPAALANGTVGQAYAATFTATGGTGPYTFTATGLPGGLTLSSGGVLSGTPTASGSFTPVVTVTDAASLSGNRSYPLQINPAPTITPTFVTVKKNSNTWAPITIVSGGTPGYTWTTTNLPPWAQVTAAGTLAPTAIRSPNVNNGIYTFTASLTDASGATAGPVTVTINVTN